MGISKTVRRQMSEGSWIRRMFETGITLKEKLGEENVFDLSLGNPVTEPPPAFYDELRRLLDNPRPGMHRYMPNAGYPETRQSIAQCLSDEIGLPFSSVDIVMCVGAGGGLNVALHSLLDIGDEVVVFAPYFVEYLYYIQNHHGQPVVVPSRQGFLPDIDALTESLTPRTKAVIVNSPNNPTGAVYDSDLLDQLGKVLHHAEQSFGTQIYLVSDEPYRKIIFDGLTYPHVYHHYNRSIVVTSHSKDLGLPGERIGYIAANPSCPGKEELIDALTFSTRSLGFVNAPALMQRVVQVLQGITVDVSEYQRKRDLLYQGLIDLGYQVHRPQGAFYMFPRSPLPQDEARFVQLLQEQGVLVVPGTGFGTPGYFRISYCVPEAMLVGALKKFAIVARQLHLEPQI